jgi:predicted DNA-binding transcriptional regulator AlpA
MSGVDALFLSKEGLPFTDIGECFGMEHTQDQEPTAAPPATATLHDYISPAQLAEELGISERTVHRWHALRQGPPRVLLGRRPYYKRASVAAWIERQERDPAAVSTTRRRRA